jgi:hypothetical protein
MLGSRAPHSCPKLLAAFALAIALIGASPVLHGAPTTSAQTGITACPQGSFSATGFYCGSTGLLSCPDGSLALPLQGCPIYPPAPSTTLPPPVTVGAVQSCPSGIVLSVSQSCPKGGAGQATSAATPALQQTGGYYCDLANGGQLWVPAGASPDHMGCTSSAPTSSSSAPPAAAVWPAATHRTLDGRTGGWL